jgi:hypothetical protein
MLGTKGNYAADVVVSMHRDGQANGMVSYLDGWMRFGRGKLSGSGYQLFSDRKTASNQPFDFMKRDNVDWDLDEQGRLHIHYKPWNFDTTWDMSCVGNMMFKYIPGTGVVTLTVGQAMARTRPRPPFQPGAPSSCTLPS